MINYFKKYQDPRFANQTSQFGFSIIEVTAAIAIISIGMIGVMSLVAQNVRTANANEKQLIAAQLAREGLELVRNRRDQNWIDGYNWKLGNGSGTQSDIYQDRDYAIDINYGTGAVRITNVDDINDAGAVLKINSNGFYEHSSGTATPFSRIITIINDDTNYIELECRVEWQEPGGARSYVASTVLYDWR